MKFSLVLATVDRIAEPACFLKALAEQTYRDFELIVVDQNQDDRLVAVLNSYRGRFPVAHLRSSPRGVSRARNLGLRHISGDVVAFPDDDCWYGPDLLAQVGRIFDECPEWDGISGRGIDGEVHETVPFRWPNKSARLSTYKIWSMADCYTVFLRRPVVERVGRFDETLGPGSGTPWGSGEPADYFLRAIAAGFEMHYDPRIEVYHPQIIVEYDPNVIRKAHAYALGEGRVLRLYRYPLWWLAYRSMRTLAGGALALAGGEVARAAYHWQVFEGRLRGWLA
ncbi:MAG TPA: glycosyltransferase family A protein [Candidatus Binataceae bacterium]|nr:glycosyltransferase family A protein [Candidatus Binataceae bacterium]